MDHAAILAVRLMSAAALVGLVAACTGTPASSPTPPSPSTGLGGAATQTPGASAAPRAASPQPTLADGAPQVLPEAAGTFVGHLTSGVQTYPALIWIDGCGHPDEICGVLEWEDPQHPEFTRCAPELVFMGQDGDRDVFEQSPSYRAGRCPATNLSFGRTSTGPRSTAQCAKRRGPPAPRSLRAPRSEESSGGRAVGRSP